MKENFHIISDGSCDLPDEYVAENNVTVVPFYVAFNDGIYFKEKQGMTVQEFYQKMVDEPKNFPKSSMPSVQDYVDAFMPYVEEDMPIICICITSKFSGSEQAARIARQMIHEDRPDAKIEVIDARINTVLQGLYTVEAVRLRDEGVPYEEAVQRLLDVRSTGRIFFTIGSMDYLRINGRIGKVASIATSRLGIRPVITLRDGEIFPSGIGRVRKKTVAKSLDLLVNYIKEVKATPKDYELVIGYGYDIEEAKEWRREIVIRLAEIGYSIHEAAIRMWQIGAAISVHTGPYALGVAILKHA